MAFKSPSRPTNPIQKNNLATLRALYQVARQKTKEHGYRTGIGALSQPSFIYGTFKPMMESSKKYKRTDDDIHEAVDLWCINCIEAEEQYGHISHWDVSRVTDMSHLFDVNYEFPPEGRKKFNIDISNWDVSNVTDMNGMFNGAKSFNQPIGCWDVSKVTDMSHMFSGAHVFNQSIGDWDVSKVTNMSSMFEGARAFKQNISEWDMSKVYQKDYMFGEEY